MNSCTYNEIDGAIPSLAETLIERYPTLDHPQPIASFPAFIDQIVGGDLISSL